MSTAAVSAVSSRKRLTILEAGFGGLELATRLSDSLVDDVRVTLIDQNESFSFGFSKLDILFGRKTAGRTGAVPRYLQRGESSSGKNA
jgi:NADH dehydrogenase FAD-containing subunit